MSLAQIPCKLANLQHLELKVVCCPLCVIFYRITGRTCSARGIRELGWVLASCALSKETSRVLTKIKQSIFSFNGGLFLLVGELPAFRFELWSERIGGGGRRGTAIAFLIRRLV